MNKKITFFQGGGRLLSTLNLQSHGAINLQKLNKYCLALFMCLFLGNTGFAASDYSTATDDNDSNTEFFCKPKITFKNTGCARMDVTSSEGYRGRLDKGKTWSRNTAKGTKWTFKVNGKTVKTWTVRNCKNSTQKIDSKGCGTCKSRVWFKNKGCEKMDIFKRENGRDQHIGNVGPNGTKEVDTFKGQRFTFKVKNKSIKTWTVNKCSNQTQNINSGGCNTACKSRVWFKNTGCQRVDIFKRENGRDQHIGNEGPNGTKEVDTFKGQRFTFKVNNKVIKTWTVNKCSNQTQKINTGGCVTANCKDIKISTSRRKIEISGLRKAPVSVVQVTNRRTGKVVFDCSGGKCKAKESIKVSAADYWVRVTYFTKDWKHICEVQKGVTVKDLTDETAKNNKSISRSAISGESNLASTNAPKTEEPSTSLSTETVPTFDNISTTKSTIEAYPNPATSTLFINTRSLVGQDGQLTLVNQFGHVVKQVSLNTLTEEQLNVNISNYQSGVYLLNIQLTNGERMTSRVLIQK